MFLVLKLKPVILQMMTELMTEILKNLLGKCGNRMISHENAPGMDSYGSVHLRKDVQTHLLREKLFWNRYRGSKERKNIENLENPSNFPSPELKAGPLQNPYILLGLIWLQ